MLRIGENFKDLIERCKDVKYCCNKHKITI